MRSNSALSAVRLAILRFTSTNRTLAMVSASWQDWWGWSCHWQQGVDFVDIGAQFARMPDEGQTLDIAMPISAPISFCSAGRQKSNLLIVADSWIFTPASSETFPIAIP